MIISMSVDEELLKEIDSLQKEQKYKGRSEVLRTALRMLVEDHKQRNNYEGEIDAILIAIHQEENLVNKIKHSFQSIIKTQLHSHLKNHKCMELFILNGEAKKIHSFKEELQKSNKIEHVKLIIS